ncbi:PREDICTED: torsin-1A-interacting protein 1-like isoform X1 [Acropora digitifera]|uniref:torsin-1A-interacting protein 1-like isoform X1 n=1 Tax=Acropora digitifera TaxID=70779 RepID=UPI00077A0D2B|nr:PREDICTED: torsin-1A-interacting protein 1-like isoform X1 [Acropora digitifera]
MKREVTELFLKKEKSVLLLCKMAPKKRLEDKNAVNEAGTDTTVVKGAGADVTFADKVMADSHGKEDAKLTQSSESSDGDKSNEQTDQKEDSSGGTAGEKAQSSEDIRETSVDRGYFFPCVMFFIPTLLLLLVAIVLGPSQLSTTSDIDHVKVFENELQSLQSVLTNQTDRFWKILKNRGLAHLRSVSSRKPLCLLLASPPPAHDVTNCLAEKLAEALDPKHKKNVLQVDGIEVKGSPGEKVKKSMDDLLKEKFQQGHRAAVIQHLELLPPPSPLLFYSYCHDLNAPHKHVAIIFTVHLPSEPDSSLPAKEAEGMVEKYLSEEVWAKENQDSVADLLSHVADTVVLMNGESGELVKTLCS